jgi:hypothetical protein
MAMCVGARIRVLMPSSFSDSLFECNQTAYHQLHNKGTVPSVYEMGWACGAYGGGERCAQGFGGEA